MRRYNQSVQSMTYIFVMTFAVALVMAITLIAAPKDTCAAGAIPALPVCDTGYYQTLQEKGWAEAQREVMVNNNVITQPPSVLALSCFPQHITQINSGSSIFSNRYTGGVTVASAIQTTIGGTYGIFTNYANASFNGVTPGLTAGCGAIRTYWNAIRCANVTNSNLNSFFAIRTAIAGGTDLRGGTCTTAGYNTAFTTAARTSSDLAYATSQRGAAYFNNARPDFCRIDPKEGTNALANSNLCSATAASGSTVRCENQNAIPTGQVIQYSVAIGNLPANTPVWSYRCINPGCYFDVSAHQGSIRYTAGQAQPAGLACTYRPYQ